MSRLTLRVSALALLGWLSSFTITAEAQTQIAQTQVAPASPVVVVTSPLPPMQIVPQPPALTRSAIDQPASVFRYGLQGFLAGGLVGVATGYLVLHEDSEDERWRDYLLATGVGAVSGAAMGILLGSFDNVQPERPVRFVMRDAVYGTLLGGLLGVTIGGLVALSSENGQDALLGASIGAVSGFALGGLIGALEGQRKPLDRRWRAALNTTRDVSGKHALGLRLQGRF
jgi:hypothetical protein